jgi:hypothetical protein
MERRIRARAKPFGLIVGLALVGGLAWIGLCWKLWREFMGIMAPEAARWLVQPDFFPFASLWIVSALMLTTLMGAVARGIDEPTPDAARSASGPASVRAG